jgi:CubicO group peptidase (beta-lactamase class C family)
MTWAQSLAANYIDGIVVLHDGVIVYEHYAGCLNDTGKHAAMSVTKSLTGLLGEMLVAEGKLDETDRVATIVPELAKSAFGDATVRQVLDMTTGLAYNEDYSDPDADVWRYGAAGNPLPKPEGYTGPRSYFEYLETVAREGEHGAAFGYKTINTDALGWIIARVTGKSVADLLAERIWSKMGAEQDAYYTVDSIGTPFAGGGLNAGLRDLARIGQLMLDGGVINGRRLIPEAAVNSIRAGGDKAAFAKAGYSLLKGWSYRGMWWVTHNEDGAYMARGVHGQAIYVDPKARMVIARFASTPQAGNAANDPTSLPAYDAVAKYLQGDVRVTK